MKVWCPTWLKAYEGPLWFCEEHAKVFDSNPRDAGCFYYNEAADEAFRSVEAFFPRSDERYQTSYGMVRNGTKIYSRNDREVPENPVNFGMMQKFVSVVDGKVWLLTYYHIARLGDYVEVKKRFPQYFQTPASTT